MGHHPTHDSEEHVPPLNRRELDILTYAAIALIALSLFIAALKTTGIFEGLLDHPSISFTGGRPAR